MKVSIRTRRTKNGSRSIYLDFYENGQRWYENLGLYLLPNEIPGAKLFNEKAIANANAIKAKRVLGIFDEQEDGNNDKSKLPKLVLVDWLDKYLEEIKCSLYYSVWTYRSKRSTVNIIKSYLKHIHHQQIFIEKVDKKFIVGFLDFMTNIYDNTKSPDNPKKMSLNTIYLHQTNFINILNVAVSEGVILTNPFHSLKRQEVIPKQQPIRDYLTRDEVIAMAKAPTTNETTKRAFMFCCFTGLRYSDVSNILWRDITQDNTGKVLSLRAMKKTGKQLIIPLNQSALSWLPDNKDYKQSQKVFNMTILNTCDKCLKKMAASVGINKKVSFHTARHTFAVLALAAGADIYSVSKLLGHKSLKSTQIYADVVMDTKIKAVNKITEFFSK